MDGMDGMNVDSVSLESNSRPSSYKKMMMLPPPSVRRFVGVTSKAASASSA